MTDIVDRATRSRMMAGIKGQNTGPETALRKVLHARGLRFRLHVANLPGRPDLVFPKFRAVVFVHGCFWHRHGGCRYATTPATRREFWQTKFDANVARDEAARMALLSAGWRVATVWECAMKPRERTFDTANLLTDWLRSDDQLLELGGADLPLGTAE